MPTNDYVFKRIFGHVGNEEITKGLITSIIKQDIYEIKLNESPILEKDLKDEKLGILDIRAKLNNQINCDIEMQVTRKKNIEKRLILYWSRLYALGIQEGEDYGVLNKTIAILIADFELDNIEEIPKFHTKWEIREEEYSKVVLTNMLEIHIIELPKLIKLIKNKKVNKKDKLALWAMFFLKPEEIGEEEMKENSDIKKAKKELDKIKQNEKEQYLAELRMKYILDQKAIQDYGFESGYKSGKEEGIKEGIKEGMKAGIKEGIKKEKEEIAKKLIEIGMTPEEVEKIIETYKK